MRIGVDEEETNTAEQIYSIRWWEGEEPVLNIGVLKCV
jgi:hypothetical protein